MILLLNICTNNKSKCQVSFEFGANVVGELGYSGDDSHFYYNNIHERFSTWRAGIKEANILGRLDLPAGFGIDTRLLLTRRVGQELDLFRLARLNAYWMSKTGRTRLSMGRIQTPFGAFYDRALPQDRLFVSPPLAYSYFTNVSPIVGFSQSLYEPNILILENRRVWGMPLGYEFGYSTGLHFHWEKKDTLSLDLAITQGSPGQFFLTEDFFQPNLMLRATFQPKYFWKQGFSVSYGGFMQTSPFNQPLETLNPYRQLLLAMHSSLGYTYFEFRTELMASFFQAPEYVADSNIFIASNDGELISRSFNCFSGYADLKAEMPFWPGTYLAYRFDYMLFPRENGEIWDDNSYRHSLALGIPINRYLLLQFTYAFQEVTNKNWDLNQFRSALILYL